MPPAAPIDAASVGVARPNRMAPSTDKMRKASGKNEVIIMMMMLPFLTASISSCFGGGASFGFSHARPMT